MKFSNCNPVCYAYKDFPEICFYFKPYVLAKNVSYCNLVHKLICIFKNVFELKIKKTK